MGYDFSPSEVDLIAREIGESASVKAADDRTLLLDAVEKVCGKPATHAHE
jgi:hypothetical protein